MLYDSAGLFFCGFLSFFFFFAFFFLSFFVAGEDFLNGFFCVLIKKNIKNIGAGGEGVLRMEEYQNDFDFIVV